MKKRWLAVLLTVTMCLSLLPVMTVAENGEEEAALWMCRLGRGDDERFILNSDPEDYFQGTRMNLGDKGRYAAIYGTETQIQNGTAELVKLEDLEIPENLSATLIDEASVAEGLYGYAFWLYANGADENGYIFYNNSGVRVRVSFNISIYESTNFNGSGTTYDYTGEEGSTFQLYMKADDGWDITDVGGGFPPCFDFTFPENEDYIILTVDVEHQAFVFDQTFFIDVTVKNKDDENAPKLTVQARFRINDKRPGSSTNFYTSLDFTEVAVGDGYPGDERVAYYKWRDVGEVQSFTANLWVQKENDVLEEADLSDPDTIAILEDYGFILDIQDTYIKVNTTVGRDKKLTLVAHGVEDSEVAFYDVGLIWNSWGQGDEIPQIEIDGVEYTFGLGEIDEEADTISMLSPGDGFGGWDPFLVAMKNYGASDEEPAGPEIYEKISDLTFEIVDYYNTTGPAKPCNVSLGDPTEVIWHGCTLFGIVVNDDSPDGAEVKLKTTFTVNGEEYSIINVISHGAEDMVDHFTLDASALTDASDLNNPSETGVLDSKANFLNWIKQLDAENGSNIYNQYHVAYTLGVAETVEFVLKLPAVTYDEIITVNTRGLDLTLRGSENESGGRTIMPGLRILRNRYPVYVNDIDFVAVEGITQSYDGETFTCGVLAAKAGDTNASGAGKARISDCSFNGFDYGVRGTADSAATLNGPCQFFNCGVGYQLADDPGNHATVKNCVFANCDTAIRILQLPLDFATYYFRIFECDFIDNNIDFDVSADGNFYFYRNFYGTLESDKTLETAKDATDILSRVPVVATKDGAETNVITNPRYILSYIWLGFTDDNFLSIDSTRETIIINEESDELVMDTEKLAESLTAAEQPVTIAVADDETEAIQATWTIN